jgi:NADH:ubiquinone oxidoreductase subunit F (NADH-binding)
VTSAVDAPTQRRPTRQARPNGLPRLLAGWYEQRRPAALDDHIARYGELPQATGSRSTALIDEIERAGLTGRGGAGFPTHRKLRAVRAQGRKPILVANGMEGEPASAKDRLLLSVAPHLVLDGAELAAQAIGADEIHVCVPRGPSSPLASLEHALDERAGAGRRRAPVSVWGLPARYVAGEETAVVNWLNGGPAKPTTTPPRPFERGVRGRPTLVQNVETLAHLALIARYGAAWFRHEGTRDDPGSVLLSVSRPKARLAIHETAFGTTIGQVAAASRLEQEIQAVLVGGYFGTWLPWSEAIDLPLTHGHLRAAGGALGAGILAFLPVAACGLCETARIARYLAGQSARQCGPCQHGLPAVANDLALICHGKDATARERASRRMRQIEGRGACRHPDGMVRLVRSALGTFSEHVAWHERHGPCSGMHRTPLLPATLREHDGTWR